MMSTAEAILEHAALAGDAVLGAKSFLHLGSRAAVDKALSRLAESGELLRVVRGRYVLPRTTRFGRRAPSTRQVAEQFSRATGEVLVPSGATEAHHLGLTTPMPVRAVYLTSGPNRRLQLGEQTVELNNAPQWQLAGPGTREGAVLRAVEWMGPEASQEMAERAVSSLSPEERQRLLAACIGAPTWLARRLTQALFPTSPDTGRGRPT